MGHSFSNGFDSGLPWVRFAHDPFLRLRATVRSKSRSAPATRFPVANSRLQAYFLSSIWVCSALVGLFWSLTASISFWRLWAAIVVIFVAAGAAIWGLKRACKGSLRWDRHAWSLTLAKSDSEDQQSLVGTLTVHLDFQRVLLVRFQGDNGSRRWLWLDRGFDPRAWLAMRRAVYSPNPNSESKRLNASSLKTREPCEDRR